MIFMPGLFDDFFDDFARPAVARKIPATTTQLMKTDVKELENGFELDIEIPGFKKEELQLELKEGYLTVSATSRQEKNEEDRKSHYIRRERFIGTSSRSFYVGDEVTEDDIKARFEDGVLNIFVPKKEELPKIPEAKYIAIA